MAWETFSRKLFPLKFSSSGINISRRGRPATESAMMQGGAPPPRFNAQNQQYTNAALGTTSI